MAGKSGAKSQGATVVPGAPEDASAKSLLHALSEIEQLSLAELRGSLPEEVLPIQPRFTYIDVACKSAAMMTLITFVTAPFSIAVVQKVMPAFGSTNPSIIDQIYVYLFSCAPSIAAAILITSIISKTYTGNVMKRVVNLFTTSYIITKMVMSILLLLVFYVAATQWITADGVLKVLSYFDIFFRKNPAAKESSYYFLMEFRQILVPAAIYATIVHLATATIISLGYIRGTMRTREIELLRKEWE